MIHELRITEPYQWLKSGDPVRRKLWLATQLHPKTQDEFARELDLPNLGKTIAFDTGLNIVAGPNGSGKTALLSLLSRLTCCSADFCSTFNLSEHLRNVRDGLYACCTVKADYSVSTFNLCLPTGASDGGNRRGKMQSLATGINGIRTQEKSTGQRTMMTIESMLDFYNHDGAVLRGDRAKDVKNFKWHVLDQIANENIAHPDDVWPLIQDYYKDNHIAPEDDAPASPVTFLMDTPDAGLDVPNLKLLYKLLLNAVARPDKVQFIVSLNSPWLIRSLMMLKDVHWIDLDESYLERISKSDLFRPSQPKAKADEPKQQPEPPADEGESD